MNLLSRLSAWLRPAPPPDPVVLRALDRVYELVEPMLKGLPGLEKKLAGQVQHALAYCDSLVAGMAQPLHVDRAAFSSDPLVHALFATADDINQMLGRSQAIRDYLAEVELSSSTSIHAMLAARRHTKKTLGVVMEGDIVRSDVPIEYLFFGDHTLTVPAASEAEMRADLRMRAFDSLLFSFRAQLDAQREQRQALRDERNVERDQVNLLRSQPSGNAMEEHARRLAELDARLLECAEALQPEGIVAALVEFLRTPEAALRLEPIQITVDRSGMVSDAAGQPGVDTLHFHQVIGRDRRRYLVMLVSFNRQDALEAVELVKDMQQRYFII